MGLIWRHRLYTFRGPLTINMVASMLRANKHWIPGCLALVIMPTMVHQAWTTDTFGETFRAKAWTLDLYILYIAERYYSPHIVRNWGLGIIYERTRLIM
jgi:hypothetical protein